MNPYGQNETQVSEGGEADLHKHLVGCQKNPGHKKFIPVKTFRIQDLPEDYRDHDLYELIKATADLTVRVDVKMTSPHRPEFYPHTNVPYPSYNMRNKTTMRLGSGEIGVRKFKDGREIDGREIDGREIDGHEIDGREIDGHEIDGREIDRHEIDAAEAQLDAMGEKKITEFDVSTRTCQCTQCHHSVKPNTVWWEIFVYTAAHVVFDDVEASHTTCRLFTMNKSLVVSLDKITVYNVNIVKDWCVLKYVTCDSLGKKLFDMAVRRSDLWWKVFNKYKNRSDFKLTFIVSHPHGCKKLISIGYLVNNIKISEYNNEYDKTKLTYTTCTCPGSSGASVYCVGCDHGHYHSGAFDRGLNYSCEGLCMK